MLWPGNVQRWVLKNYNAGNYIKIHDVMEHGMLACRVLGVILVSLILVAFNLDPKAFTLTVHNIVIYGIASSMPLLAVQIVHNTFKRIMKSVEGDAAKQTLKYYRESENINLNKKGENNAK